MTYPKSVTIPSKDSKGEDIDASFQGEWALKLLSASGTQKIVFKGTKKGESMMSYALAMLKGKPSGCEDEQKIQKDRPCNNEWGEDFMNTIKNGIYKDETIDDKDQPVAVIKYQFSVDGTTWMLMVRVQRTMAYQETKNARVRTERLRTHFHAHIISPLYVPKSYAMSIFSLYLFSHSHNASLRLHPHVFIFAPSPSAIARR